MSTHNICFHGETRKIFNWYLLLSSAGLGGSVGCASDWRPGGRGFDPRRGWQHSFVEIDHEIFSKVILSLPLIQEGQLSVSGERMCTVLVNRLEDKACPVNVWLGKLTALMTPLGWLGRKTSTQTNSYLELCTRKKTENFRSQFNEINLFIWILPLVWGCDSSSVFFSSFKTYDRSHLWPRLHKYEANIVYRI